MFSNHSGIKVLKKSKKRSLENLQISINYIPHFNITHVSKKQNGKLKVNTNQRKIQHIKMFGVSQISTFETFCT